MYLSRIEMNRQRAETKRALLNPNIMHASIKTCFPKSDGRTLWRVDMLGHNLYVLMVSPIKPDFTAVIQQYGWPACGQTGESRDYSPLVSRISAGSKWRFRLVANPVYAGGGKRHACETLDKKRQWLLERAERNGFLLEENSFDIVGSDTVKFCRGRNHKHEVTLSRVTFEGALSIADAEPFKTALVQGIGHAKAYGCGMLTIAGLQ